MNEELKEMHEKLGHMQMLNVIVDEFVKAGFDEAKSHLLMNWQRLLSEAKPKKEAKDGK